MFMRKPRHKVFDYTPRHYKPEEDEDERRKRRLGFQRTRKYIKSKNSGRIWMYVAIILAIIYLIVKFQKIG